ncbi:MAG TPA: HPF/RaiA family ribosome-associated protein [Woeseiaceae bacterium]|nr:HPF/RaiA family ribosome-associated protein [Woeseiaceae bacterium]
MQLPLEITFDNIDPSPALEAEIRRRAGKLERFAGDIVSCRVTVSAPHQHHRHGRLFRVSVDVRLPGSEIVVNREPSEHHAHEDVYVAIRDAFNAARRQVQDVVRKRRGDVKTHEVPPHGFISVINADADYGRITTPQGREIYFHRNSIVGKNFTDLKVGDAVRFSEEPGERGPQATSVQAIGKHRVAG